VAKILSKSGDSLADVYDVVGSIAGIDELISEDVNLVHEMGATIFSERLGGRIVRVTTGAIAASVTFNQTFDVSNDVPGSSRVLGVQVVTDDESRISRVQLSITSPPQIDDTDLPIAAWQVADPTVRANILVSGTVAAFDILVPTSHMANIPSLIIGNESDAPIDLLSLRGLTQGFGAGTVTITALVYMAFSQPGGLSNRGLPLPSW